MIESAGARFRAAVERSAPLQIVGTINAFSARLAARAGFQALYLSGGGVAAASCGIPDLGITTLDDVLVDLRRLVAVTDRPILVDADTGWGSALNIERTVRSLIAAGAGALHIEDQVQAKRCGHRTGKALVSSDEMCDRIKVAVDARTEPEFVLMARTDALASEGLQATIDRANAYVDAGADMIFPEAVDSLDTYRALTASVDVPVLANITEFGQTPLFTREQLAEAGVAMVLYPLSAFRAMSLAAAAVYEAIARDGTQQGVVALMQTRNELYEVLDYHAYEERLDALFGAERVRGRSS